MVHVVHQNLSKSPSSLWTTVLLLYPLGSFICRYKMCNSFMMLLALTILDRSELFWTNTSNKRIILFLKPPESPPSKACCHRLRLWSANQHCLSMNCYQFRSFHKSRSVKSKATIFLNPTEFQSRIRSLLKNPVECKLLATTEEIEKSLRVSNEKMKTFKFKRENSLNWSNIYD